MQDALMDPKPVFISLLEIVSMEDQQRLSFTLKAVDGAAAAPITLCLKVAMIDQALI